MTDRLAAEPDPGAAVPGRRLAAQGLLAGGRDLPDVVRGLGAVQAQEFRFACWSLALRAGHPGRDTVRQFFDEGHVIRTHALRPTWHFLHAQDVGWVQRLTARRVLAAARHQERNVGIDDLVAGRALEVVHDALRAAGGPLSRPELGAAVRAAGIDTSGIRLAFLLMRAELGNLVTSGPLRDRTHTYDLLDRRVPAGRDLEGDEALAELAARYFAGHGPAGEKDFAWWATLTLAQVRHGIALAGERLEHVDVDGVRLWQAAGTSDAPRGAEPPVLLLPVYDEYVVAYPHTRHHVYTIPGVRWSQPNAQAQPFVVDGHVVGWWRQARTEPTLDLTTFVGLTPAQRDQAEAAATAFLAFDDCTAAVRWTPPPRT